jgi:hypothetical protein
MNPVGGTDPLLRYDELVKLYLFTCLGLAACGFQIGVGGQDPPPSDADGDAPLDAGDGDGDGDAPVDAPIDMTIPMIDAPCADDDMDGVCNTLDTWPCGAQPESPGSPITFDEVQNGDHVTISLSNTTLTGGQRLHTVAPGATFTVTASYSILDCICTNCIDQIQVGLVPGTTKQCIYSGNPTCPSPTTGAGMTTLTAPMTPGVYQVRFRLGQDFDCDGNSNNNNGWWTNVPPMPAQTVALVCVK